MVMVTVMVDWWIDGLMDWWIDGLVVVVVVMM